MPMKKILIWGLIAVFLLSSIPVSATSQLSYSTTVDNLQPRTNLDLTVDPFIPTRMIDLVIQNDMLYPSTSEVEQLINAEVVPMLHAKGIDVRTTYLRPPGYKQDPIFWKGGLVNEWGEVYLLEWRYQTSWLKVTSLGDRKIVSGTNARQWQMGYLLDDSGNVYCYENQSNLERVYLQIAQSGLSKLIDGGYYVYAINHQGQLYGLNHSYYYYSCYPDYPPTLTPLRSGVIDAAGLSETQYLAVTTDGRVVGYGNGIFNPNDWYVVNNGGVIQGLTNVKDIEVIYGNTLDGEFQLLALALTADGEVYSWGQGKLGRAGNHLINRIPVPERIVRMVTDYQLRAYLISESGNVYGLNTNSYYLAASGMVYYHNRYYVNQQGILTFNDNMNQMTVFDRSESLESALNRVTAWRSNAEKYFLHVTDTLESQVSDSRGMSSIAGKMLAGNIRYIGLTNTQEEAMRTFVAAMDHRGKVVRGTGNLPLHFRQIGQYIVQKQAMDVVFNIGHTAHDDLKAVQKLLKEQLVPALEQFGIELKLTVMDGIRVPEDRVYYQNNGQIYQYDPRNNSTQLLVSRRASMVNVHQSGDLYYIETGTRNVYRYDTTRYQETLYYTLPETPYSDQMVVDASGKIWYQVRPSYGYYVMKRLDPVTHEVTNVRTVYDYPFSSLTPGTIDEVIFTGPTGYDYKIVYPQPSYDQAIRGFVQGQSGCIYYTYTHYMAIPAIKSTCDNTYLPITYAQITAPADRDFFFFNYLGNGYDSPALKLYNPETGSTTVVHQGSVTSLTSTPAGRHYYKVNNTTYWYDWRTGQKGTVPISLSNVVPYRLLNVEKRRTSKFSLYDGIYNTIWRTGSDSYYVYMDDYAIDRLDGTAPRLWEDQVSLVVLGREANRAQVQSFVQHQMNGHGTHIDNTNLSSAISGLISYLLNQAGVPKYAVNEEKVILEYDEATGTYRSGQLVFHTDYSDPESDPKYKERWIFAHDHTYYENPLGQLPEHNQTLAAPITVLTRPGQYTVSYEVGDRPKADARFAEFERWSEKAQLTIYAHRRPIADYAVGLGDAGNGYLNLWLVDHSYDPDRMSAPNRGLTAWQWKWKKYDDPDWTNGPPPSKIYGGTLYLISYRVKDMDGAWSNEKIVSLYPDTFNNAPIARFTVTSPITVNQEYTIVDQSWDPDGDPIVERRWEVSKDGKLIYEGSAQPTAATLRALAAQQGLSVLGMYDITLAVRDQPWRGSPLWSAPFVQSFTIINQPPVPGFTWTPTTLHAGGAVQVRHALDDPEQATLSVRYQVTAPDGSVTYYPASGSYTVAPANYSANAFSITNLKGGTYTIMQTVSDGYETRTLTKTMDVIPNQPPVPGFTWTPATLYQGDAVQVRHAVSDPDQDTLMVRYQVTAPDGSVSYHPMTGSYTVAPSSYSANAFAVANLKGGTYTIVQTVSDGVVTVTLTRMMDVIPNRPPVADFTWTPTTIWEGDTVSFTNLSSDPDGDALTYAWVITYPNGGQYTTSAVHPGIRLTQPGTYTVRLTVSDGWLTATRTQTLQVGQLTLTADVHHTEAWLAYHRDAGHEIATHPKDFYSGEKLMLSAATDPAPVRAVTATLTAVDRQGAGFSVTVTLDAAQARSYRGEMYEERFSSLERGMANGTYVIRFQAEYVNGTTKTADVPIRIIGHVLESVGVHRRR